jgi:hypothetical protein
MPLTKDGMRTKFYGDTPHKQILEKIDQLRRDMTHIQMALQAIEGPVRGDQAFHPNQVGATPLPPDVAQSLKPRLSDLHNWCLSALESYYSIVWVASGTDMVDRVMQDFGTKFKNFTKSVSYTDQPHRR